MLLTKLPSLCLLKWRISAVTWVTHDTVVEKCKYQVEAVVDAVMFHLDSLTKNGATHFPRCWK